MYLASERKEYILKLLAERGSVRTIVLSKEMNVTDETVRNDLISLEKSGLLKRVHGGAISLKKKALNDSITTNVSIDVNIAKTVAKLIKGGTSLFIDGGVLGSMTAAHLPSLPMTVITNSHSIIGRLDGHPQIDVFCTGGLLDKKTGLFIGQGAARALSSLNMDIAILTPDSYDPKQGVGYTSLARAEFCQEVIKSAKSVIVLVTEQAFSTSSTYFSIMPDKVSVLITNENAPKDVTDAISKSRVRLVTA